MRLVKEQKKIRDFFSKQAEERDGIGQAHKLPLVNKNLRHHQQHQSTSKKKKPASLISRQQQQKELVSV